MEINILETFFRVVDFAVPIIIMIFLGLIGAGMLIEMGFMQRFSGIVKPLFSHTNLPDSCAATFIVALGSTVAANSMVVKLKEDQCLQNREVVLCAALNSTPAYFREILTYQIPIVIPALGLIVGGFYVMVFIATAIIKISIIVLLSRLFLKKSKCNVPEDGNSEKVSLSTAFQRALKREKKLFIKIATIYLAMTTLVFILQDMGVFDIFSVLPLADIFGIPPESIVPLTSYVVSPILGISLLGPMIHEGTITAIQAMIILMVGSMFMIPFFGIKSLLPRYVSIFGPKTGITIVSFSLSMTMGVRLTILIVLLLIAS